MQLLRAGPEGAILANATVPRAFVRHRSPRALIHPSLMSRAGVAVARRELAQSVSGPPTDLTAALLSAWTLANATEVKQALDGIEKLAGADWYAIFKELHSALILEVAGQRKEAARRYERAYKLAP